MKRTILWVLLVAVFVLLMACPAGAEEVISEGGEEESSVDGGLISFVTDFFAEHTAEIFSALSVGASLLVAVLYKIGLFPTLSRSLGKITAAAGGAAETANHIAGTLASTQNAVVQTVEPLLEKTTQIQVALADEQKNLSQLQTKVDILNREEMRFREILLGETEMLYGVLQSAALPQYQKEALAEQYIKMKRALAGIDEELREAAE